MGNSHPNTPQTAKQARAKQGRLNLGGLSSSSGRKLAPAGNGTTGLRGAENAPLLAAKTRVNKKLETSAPSTNRKGTKSKRQPLPDSSNSATQHDKSSNELSSSPQQQQRLPSSGSDQRTSKRSRKGAADEQPHGGAAADELMCPLVGPSNQLPPLVGSRVLSAKERRADDDDEMGKLEPLLHEDSHSSRSSLGVACKDRPLLPVSGGQYEPTAAKSPPGELATNKTVSSFSRQPPQPATTNKQTSSKPKANLIRSSSLYVTRKNMTHEPGSQLIMAQTGTGTSTTRFSAAAVGRPNPLASRLYSAEPSAATAAAIGGDCFSGALSMTTPFQRFALVEDQRQRVRHWLNTQPFDQVQRWNKRESGSQMESSDTASEQSEPDARTSAATSSSGESKLIATPTEDIDENQPTTGGGAGGDDNSAAENLMDAISVSSTSSLAGANEEEEVEYGEDEDEERNVDERASLSLVEEQDSSDQPTITECATVARPRSSSMQITDGSRANESAETTQPPNDDCSLCQYLESIQATVVDKEVLVSGGAASAGDNPHAIGQCKQQSLSIDRKFAAKTALAQSEQQQQPSPPPPPKLGNRQEQQQLARQLNWQSTKTTTTDSADDVSLNWLSADGKAARDDQGSEDELAGASGGASTIAEAANHQSWRADGDRPIASSPAAWHSHEIGMGMETKAPTGSCLAETHPASGGDTIGSLSDLRQRERPEKTLTTTTATTRTGRLKVMRGYSLDQGGIGSKSGANNRAANTTSGDSGRGKTELKRTRSRPNLGQAFRGKSQSRRLIVINSDNASYTIQVATGSNTDCARRGSSSSTLVDPAKGDKPNQASNSGTNYNHNHHQQQQQRQVAKYILRKQRVDKFQSQRATQSFDEIGCCGSINPTNAAIESGTVLHALPSTAIPSNREFTATKKLSTSLNFSRIKARGLQGETNRPANLANRVRARRHTHNQPIYQTMVHDRPAQAGVSNKSDDSSINDCQAQPKKSHSISDTNDRSSVLSLKQISKKSPGSYPGTDHRSLMDMVTLNFQAAQSAESANATNCNDETAKSCNLASKQLRDLAAHLEHGSVPQSVLYQTLEYAAAVLDAVTMDQISRVSDEEDGDLSEVQSDAVPNEVRKWLETTFTRNSISQKRKSEDKLKFRSVANAIRAGIVVDRIYRRTSASIPFVSAEVCGLLKSIDDWSFDCFAVNQVSAGQVLKSVGYELFNRYGLMYKFKIPTTVLKNFLTQIEQGYTKHKNPYHNNLHAADVTQTVHYMLWQAGLTNWLTDLEIFATLLAAIIHDYLHTGTTNNFHVMSQSETALIYNDRAVLENFHICQAFTLMRNEDCNILAGLTKDEYREFRSLVIDMVLATDMSSHFQQIKAMKNILNHSDNFNADKSKILSLVIHISDISHPAKEWELHSQWTQLLMEEFFRQGDREKNLDLECSPLCDRETTLVAESQLGFIEFIVSPSLEVCGDVLDRVHHQMAEANARPVMPASAKAASMVAVGGSSSNKQQQQKQDNRPTPAIEPAVPVVSKANSNSSATSSAGGSASLGSNSSGATAAAAGPCSSFVSSETLTSNLRKMIVSSSATIGRKLNISGSSSSASSAASAASGQQPPTTTLAAARSSAKANLGASDFETRQANYKHPVIQQEASRRPKSSDPRVRQQQGCDTIQQQDNRLVSSTTADRDGTDLAAANRSNQANIEQVPTRGASSALASHYQSHHFKIKRPWIACLERNKKIWHERAITDAQARELKEKLKQQQIQEAPSEEQQ